ncbi:MAG: type II toxin-antitoxin system VapC family toxin [Pseudomonadota bacterium]
MARYLLDTNVLSELVRDPRGRVAQRVSRHAPDEVCTSVIVACEMRFGAGKKGSEALSARIEALLGTIAVEPLLPGVDRRYGSFRAALERAGKPVGAMDLLIAAHAAELDCVLVTRNRSEFARIRGLRVEAWAPDPH